MIADVKAQRPEGAQAAAGGVRSFLEPVGAAATAHGKGRKSRPGAAG
jgi:hypothetical protein